MKLQRFPIPSLGQVSYLVSSGGDAIAIDPIRDTRAIVDAASSEGLRIRHVLMTHVPEDYVGGHFALNRWMAAEIGLSGKAGVSFVHRILKGGDVLRLGSLMIEVIETPGHSPDSLCYLVQDTEGPARALFTGDTLLLKETGRVDHLGEGAAGRALQLHRSVHERLFTLPDDTPVHPGHTSGSLVSLGLGPEPSGTIGEERRRNRVATTASPEEFASYLAAHHAELPQSWAHVAEENRNGLTSHTTHGELPALAPDEFQKLIRSGAVTLDVRLTPDYNGGHIEGALHIGLDGQMETWAGILIRPGTLVALIAPEDLQREALVRLARIGYEENITVLQGGMEAWRAAGFPVLESFETSPGETPGLLRAGTVTRLLDVRREWEWNEGHVEGAIHIPLCDLPARASELDPAEPLAVVCRLGYRSSVASSVLERAGVRAPLYNVTGGMLAWADAGVPTCDI